MENILNYYIKTNGSIKQASNLYDFLDNGGQVITNGGTFQIPTNSLYFIGNFNRYKDFTDSLTSFQNGPVNNGFDANVSKLLGKIIDGETQMRIVLFGIIEATSDASLLGLLVDNFDFSGSGGRDLLTILDMGIIMYYHDKLDNMIICSVADFINYTNEIPLVSISDLIRFNYYGDIQIKN